MDVLEKILRTTKLFSDPIEKEIENVGKDGTECKDCNCFFEFKSANDNLINYKFLYCNRNHSKQIEEI